MIWGDYMLYFGSIFLMFIPGIGQYCAMFCSDEFEKEKRGWVWIVVNIIATIIYLQYLYTQFPILTLMFASYYKYMVGRNLLYWKRKKPNTETYEFIAYGMGLLFLMAIPFVGQGLALYAASVNMHKGVDGWFGKTVLLLGIIFSCIQLWWLAGFAINDIQTFV